MHEGQGAPSTHSNWLETSFIAGVDVVLKILILVSNFVVSTIFSFHYDKE